MKNKDQKRQEVELWRIKELKEENPNEKINPHRGLHLHNVELVFLEDAYTGSQSPCPIRIHLNSRREALILDVECKNHESYIYPWCLRFWRRLWRFGGFRRRLMKSNKPEESSFSTKGRRRS